MRCRVTAPLFARLATVARMKVARMKVARMSLLALTMTGCARDPVQWGDVSYRRSQLGDPDTRSGVLSAGLPVVDSTVSSCLRSIRAVGAGPDLFRVWWAVRKDSSA